MYTVINRDLCEVDFAESSKRQNVTIHYHSASSTQYYLAAIVKMIWKIGSGDDTELLKRILICLRDK